MLQWFGLLKKTKQQDENKAWKNSHPKGGAPKGGAPIPEKWGPRRVGPRRVGPRVWGAKNSAFFFSSPATISLFFCLSGCLLVEFWWCLKRRDPQMCTFGVLGLSCEAPAAPKPPGFHTTAREARGEPEGPKPHNNNSQTTTQQQQHTTTQQQQHITQQHITKVDWPKMDWPKLDWPKLDWPNLEHTLQTFDKTLLVEVWWIPVDCTESGCNELHDKFCFASTSTLHHACRCPSVLF